MNKGYMMSGSGHVNLTSNHSEPSEEHEEEEVDTSGWTKSQLI